jgi:hypothetical protein
MSDEINVISRSQTIIVDPTSSSVSVLHEQGPPGPVGPAGPEGPAGPAATNLVEWGVFGPMPGAMAANVKQVIGMTLVHKTAGISIVGQNKITVAAAGRYRVTALTTVQGAAGWITAFIEQYRSAGTLVETVSTVSSTGGSFGIAEGNWIFDMLAGDYIQIAVTPQVAANADNRSLYTIQKLDTGPQGATGPPGPVGPPHPSSVAAVAGTVLRGNADLNIPSAASQVIVVPTTLFQTGTDTEKVDVAGFTYQIKILTEGLYHINGYVRSGPAGPSNGSIVGIQVNGIMVKRETLPVVGFSSVHLSTEAYLMVGDLVNMVGYSPSGVWTSSYAASGNAVDPAAPTLEVWRIAGGPKGDKGEKGDPGGPLIPSVEAWIALPLATGWTNLGGEYETAAYYKDPFGIVHIKGVVNHGSNRNATVATLPTGYRPPLSEFFPIVNSDTFGQMRIHGLGSAVGDGIMRMTSPTGQTAGWISLDGITFRAR